MYTLQTYTNKATTIKQTNKPTNKRRLCYKQEYVVESNTVVVLVAAAAAVVTAISSFQLNRFELI